jgi:hypothetical protein
MATDTHRAGQSQDGRTQIGRYATSGQRALWSGAATRLLGRSRRIDALVARDQFRVGAGIRECHPRARMLSINAASSVISRLSSSSASRAATSAANAARFRRRPALSRRARRIASDLLRPVASSCASTWKFSVERVTRIELALSALELYGAAWPPPADKLTCWSTPLCPLCGGFPSRRPPGSSAGNPAKWSGLCW